MQADYLPEYKLHPLLKQQLGRGSVDSPLYTLAVSFPLFHDCTHVPACESAKLPLHYDPGGAAEEEWPDQLLQAGMPASISRGSQHHVKLTSRANLEVDNPAPCSMTSMQA